MRIPIRPPISIGALSIALIVSVAAAQSEGAPSAEPLEHIEVLTGGAGQGEPLPMVVMLHGRGDDPARWSERIPPEIPERARIVLVRAPLPLGSGFEWFRYRGDGQSLGPIGAQIARTVPRLVATIDRLRETRPTLGLPIVTGFSQGAMMTYALAVTHPERLAAAFPVAGFMLPRTLRELAEPAAVPPIIAFHGTLDRIIPIDADRRTVRALRARGVPAELRESEGVGHALDRMSGALLVELRAAIRDQSAR
jgi:phospholipase/carboxylesterase